MKPNQTHLKQLSRLCAAPFFITLLATQPACTSTAETSASPPTGGFTIVAVPDTQNYHRTDIGKVYFSKQMEWIQKNALTQDCTEDSVPFKNIVFVTHLGDVVSNARGDEQHQQWINSLKQIGKLDGAVPYSISLGDHDYNVSSMPDSGHSAFVKHYGPARYASYNWYGGSSSKGTSHYQVFTAAGRTFLHINLEVDAPDSSQYPGEDDQLAWAQTVLDANKELPAIITTHAYLTDVTEKGPDGKQVPYEAGGQFVGHGTDPEIEKGLRENEVRRDGRTIWRDFVRKNNQIFMVLGGNYHDYLRDQGGRKDYLGGEYFQISNNDFGQSVIEVLANYQDHPNGGNGLIRLITFNTKMNQIHFETYDTFEDRFRRENMVPRPGDTINPRASEFAVSIDFNSRFKF
jgi:hypothetical protein